MRHTYITRAATCVIRLLAAKPRNAYYIGVVGLPVFMSVIETGAIQKLGCGFLFAFHSNHTDILYRLRDIATYW